MKKKALSILSGGLDSSVATILAMKDYDVAQAVTFDYGQLAAAAELRAAKAFCEEHQIQFQSIDIGFIRNFGTSALTCPDTSMPKVNISNVDDAARETAKAVWVPNRNAILISISAGLAESLDIDTVITGFNLEEAQTFPDNTETFIERLNAAMEYSTANKVKLISPTAPYRKQEIAGLFLKHNLSLSNLWPCYNSAAKWCGGCESCVRTMRAFKAIGKYELLLDQLAD